MTRQRNVSSTRRHGSLFVLALVVTQLSLGLSVHPARAADASSFQEVGQVPIPDAFYKANSGWLILDPVNRRGYTLTETLNTQSPGAQDATIIESFDLDTLKPLKSTMIAGVPIPSGDGSGGPGQAQFSGDIIYAVDSRAKRIYIPMHKLGTNTPGPGNDTQRLVSYVMVLDEAQFDSDPDHAFGSFSFTGAEQRLSAYPLVGMEITYHHSAPGEPGDLLAVFASVYPMSTANIITPVPAAVVFDHTLVAWSPGRVATGKAPAPPLLDPAALQAEPLLAKWQQVLMACATAPLTSAGTEDAPSGEAKNLQWGILPTKSAIFLGCQSAPGSGGVARVPLDAAGTAQAAGQQIVALGKPVGDVLVDHGGQRLYVRSFGGGATWWAFDARAMRFSGSIAAHLTDVKPMAAGIDQATGRLYTLTPDTCGGAVPFRGGIKMSEARLDPVPALENLRPDLAYNSWWRIHVDPVTRKVFVRRGVSPEGLQLSYPECDGRNSVQAPQEFFYRVFEDRVPLATQPADLDDAPFTTNVPEKSGLTQASYLGSGAGYGARVVLTGGLDAVTNGAVTNAGESTTFKWSCGREDREFRMGSVGGVEVSDQSTRAEAASLDADSQSIEVLGDPLSRCRPQVPPQAPNHEQMNRCHADTEELAFDERDVNDKGEHYDANKDGCLERTRVNAYETHCIQDDKPAEATGPKNRVVSRDGFKASAVCDAQNEKAQAKAAGGVGEAYAKERERLGIPSDIFRVGHSSSEVKVSRELGKGVTVTVDSIARGIDIAGVGSIGVVRSEARSTSTGRDGGAEGEYTRTVCDITIGDRRIPGCVGEGLLTSLVADLNTALGGRAEIRVRKPDKKLLDGTRHGYLAAVQRDRAELFADQTITRDRSLAVPGLEIILYQGEGGPWGAGRQVLQLAGAQASTSYGIACVFGLAANGSCAKELDGFGVDDLVSDLDSFDDVGGDGASDGSIQLSSDDSSDDNDEPRIVELIKKIPQAIAEVMRLLFNNPRELGLMAAVWGLLYAPCYLGERRRKISGLSARRATVGGVV